MNHSTVLYSENDDNDVLLMRRAWTKAGMRDRLPPLSDGEEGIHYLSGKGPAVRADQYLLKPGLFGEWVALVHALKLQTP